MRIPRYRAALFLILLVAAAAVVFWIAASRTPSRSQVGQGMQSAESTLTAATVYFSKNMVRSDGHVVLYVPLDWSGEPDYNSTNSEAVSYYLLWNAEQKNKSAFDKVLNFMETKMMQPRLGYLMWRLESNDSVVNDGSNIASDADLRAIKALLIAEKQWKDKRYTELIDRLASGLEKVAVTGDGYLAPYGGVSGDNSAWTAKEVWLSYSDFTVFRDLAARRGGVWNTVYSNMKDAVLGGQIWNGLYNSVLTEQRKYGNSVDNGGYAVNSMWMMVRSAESGDKALMDSARKSLDFYKRQYNMTGKLYISYNSDGTVRENFEGPWVYALAGRAAVVLGDQAFADQMIGRLSGYQVKDRNSTIYGAFPEGDGSRKRIGQFTMQESILTLQKYLKQ